MKLIIKDRGMGKTTQLIHISEATGYPIATAYKKTIDHIKSTAKKLGYNIPEPVLVSDIATGKIRYDNILVDEITLDGVLKKALNNYFNSNVVACTCSPDITVNDFITDDDIDAHDHKKDVPKRYLTVSCN